MDKIYVNRMEFYGYHGVFPEENRLGQRFSVDLTVSLDLKKAGDTDELLYSVNYGELFQLCKEIVEGKPKRLVEAVAEKIAGSVLQEFPAVKEVTVMVIKPDPPIPGHYKSVAVEITRSR
ncbi:dihydroneopterin aldolase [Neobacillus ginsengisoli]|uniref:7,8-dihydroneopterin aldolase n=1 Tax=Neobacillus ginsengisoli TaxID=904295 RepID=A0ABT9Y2U5_9BACI|nr:dihydroneopterin aldolase [Neobacillus ginsengisoli]MDQ0202150.1 dihydroneopterin aldolase [Neobacillus ginsengisoli]